MTTSDQTTTPLDLAPIPDELIEVAARAQFDADQEPERLNKWEDIGDWGRQAYRDRARAGLAAVGLPALLAEVERLTAEREGILAFANATIERHYGDNATGALAALDEENASPLQRLEYVMSLLGDLAESFADVPFCSCGEDGDGWAECLTCGPVALLNALDLIATHSWGVADHEKAIADALHAAGVDAGVSRAELARAARRWGYACPVCHGDGRSMSQAGSPCPECDGSPDYYEPSGAGERS